MLAEQQLLPFPRTRGGARPGAGRPRGSRRSTRIPHVRRPRVSRHHPHHVTVRVARGTWNLRSQRCFAWIRRALGAVRARSDYRVVHFSVQRDHMHFVIEAESRGAMANGMRSLLIRIARRLNNLMSRRGPRFADRYHEHILRTPTAVRNAVRYVLGNREHHLGRPATLVLDPFTSLARTELVRMPDSWLMRVGWTRAGPM